MKIRAYGLDAEFPTLVGVQTNPATLIGVDNARLNGEIINFGEMLSIDVSFEYGLDEGGPYPFSTPIETKVALGAFHFHADIIGLSAGERYYFRAKAQDIFYTITSSVIVSGDT